MSFYNTYTYVALTWNENTIKTSTRFAMTQFMSANFKLNVYINETGNLVSLCCQFLSVGHNWDIITSLNISVESDQVWFDLCLCKSYQSSLIRSDLICVCVSHISRVWSRLIWSCLCKLLSRWLTQTHWDWVGLYSITTYSSNCFHLSSVLISALCSRCSIHEMCQYM